MRDKITVLFLASDPFRDRAPLRLDAEVGAIDLALRKGNARDQVELVAHLATGTRDLQDALMRHDPRIVHFAGDGDDAGVLYLGDAHGRRCPVGQEALATLFGILNEWIKVVVLNGCDTLPTVEALSGVVDYVVGMDRPLADASAVRFAEAFYGALAMGRTVPRAFELAARRVELDERSESTAPVLRIRPGVDPDAPLVTVPAAALPSLTPADVNVFATFHADETRDEDHPGRRFTYRNSRPN